MWTACLRLERRGRGACPGLGAMDAGFADAFGKCRRYAMRSRRRETRHPRDRNMMPNLASQMRIAFSSMA